MNHTEIVVQWKEFAIPNVLPRAVTLKLIPEFITTVIGPRRAGKTFLCFQLIHKLLQEGTPRDNMLYLNFEDEKLIGATADDLSKLLATFQELSDIKDTFPLYLFLDEIQAVSNWDSWVRRVHDTQQNTKLIITGSSSKMLSKEISTTLRGRTITTEVFPLSFQEFAQWKGIPYNLKTISHSKEKTAIKKLFAEYLVHGGYPSIIKNTDDKDIIIQGYYKAMIFKDIVERHNVKKIKKLQLLASLLFESVTKEISYNKLANKLKSLGLSTSKNTIIEYISYFEDAYLFFQNLKYEYSITKQLGALKKIYCLDNGLLNSVSFAFSKNTGKLMENAAFIELKRRKKEIYYHTEKADCDFIIKEKEKIVQAVQVTAVLSEENQKREFQGLLEAMNKYSLKEGTILTENQEEELAIEGKKIHIMPLWKWLLTDEKGE